MSRSIPMRILVAEDNHILATLLSDHLSERGHRVVPAYEGRLASLFCQHRHFDVIVIDLVLPDLDGIEVLEQLQGRHSLPRVIVITGFPELLKELSTRLAALGVETVIQKPFSFSEVDDALARIGEHD
jgi:DNA-binding response OmpR family regulator